MGELDETLDGVDVTCLTDIRWEESKLYFTLEDREFEIHVRYGGTMGFTRITCGPYTDYQIFEIEEPAGPARYFYESLRFLEHNRRRYAAEVDPARKNFNCLDRQLYGLGEYCL